jgi:acyl-CoA thioesterase FadM
MKVYYEVYNEQGKLLADGNTTLAFLSKETGRPQRAPEIMVNFFSQYLKTEPK